MKENMHIFLRNLALRVLGYKFIGGGVSGDYITIYANKR